LDKSMPEKRYNGIYYQLMIDAEREGEKKICN
jgi:hypothetical protein